MNNQIDVSAIAIVIPVYTTTLTAAEEASLKQCMHVLRRYPVKILKPESLDV
jgi:hypothetical protein